MLPADGPSPVDALAEAMPPEVIDAEFIKREAVALYRKCLGEVKPALDKKGRQRTDPATGEPLFVFNGAVALRSLELLARHVDINALVQPSPIRLAIDGGAEIVAQLHQGRLQSRMAITDLEPAEQGGEIVFVTTSGKETAP